MASEEMFVSYKLDTSGHDENGWTMAEAWRIFGDWLRIESWLESLALWLELEFFDSDCDGNLEVDDADADDVEFIKADADEFPTGGIYINSRRLLRDDFRVQMEEKIMEQMNQISDGLMLPMFVDFQQPDDSVDGE